MYIYISAYPYMYISIYIYINIHTCKSGWRPGWTGLAGSCLCSKYSYSASGQNFVIFSYLAFVILRSCRTCLEHGTTLRKLCSKRKMRYPQKNKTILHFSGCSTKRENQCSFATIAGWLDQLRVGGDQNHWMKPGKPIASSSSSSSAYSKRNKIWYGWREDHLGKRCLGWPKIQCGRKVNGECEISLSEKFDASKEFKGEWEGNKWSLGRSGI